MRTFRKILALTLCFAGLSAFQTVQAQDSWTEIGAYGFASDISGDATIGNVNSEVDVPFSDLLEDLDLGLMVFAEHRRGNWSFIGDVFYAEISDENSLASNRIISANVDAEVKQLMAEGFVGYRFFEQQHEDKSLGVDLLGGVRYNSLEFDLGIRARLLGLTASTSRSRTEDWVDGVVGLRAQYGGKDGWGISGWVDIGEGSDSSSYQIAGFVGYRFENNIRLFGGYRHYHFEFDEGSGASRIGFDLDYSGPMLGISYRF
jgi:hypothetical protein